MKGLVSTIDILGQDHVKLLAREGKIEAKKVGRAWIILSLDYKRKRKSKIKKGE